jgi:hypothetical protein
MKRANEINVLLNLVGEAYEDRAWHGVNLRGSIRGLSAEQAAWRPASNRHNIWEIILHAAYWKYTLRRRLLGEKKGSFPLKGSNWFVCPPKYNDRTWHSDIKLLDQMHKSMYETIATLSTSDLKHKFAGSKFSFLSSISGIAFHDVYHAGQIQLIKRLMIK